MKKFKKTLFLMKIIFIISSSNIFISKAMNNLTIENTQNFTIKREKNNNLIDENLNKLTNTGLINKNLNNNFINKKIDITKFFPLYQFAYFILSAKSIEDDKIKECIFKTFGSMENFIKKYNNLENYQNNIRNLLSEFLLQKDPELLEFYYQLKKNSSANKNYMLPKNNLFRSFRNSKDPIEQILYEQYYLLTELTQNEIKSPPNLKTLFALFERFKNFLQFYFSDDIEDDFIKDHYQALHQGYVLGRYYNDLDFVYNCTLKLDFLKNKIIPNLNRYKENPINKNYENLIEVLKKCKNFLDKGLDNEKDLISSFNYIKNNTVQEKNIKKLFEDLVNSFLYDIYSYGLIAVYTKLLTIKNNQEKLEVPIPMYIEKSDICKKIIFDTFINYCYLFCSELNKYSDENSKKRYIQETITEVLKFIFENKIFTEKFFTKACDNAYRAIEKQQLNNKDDEIFTEACNEACTPTKKQQLNTEDSKILTKKFSTKTYSKVPVPIGKQQTNTKNFIGMLDTTVKKCIKDNFENF